MRRFVDVILSKALLSLILFIFLNVTAWGQNQAPYLGDDTLRLEPLTKYEIYADSWNQLKFVSALFGTQFPLKVNITGGKIKRDPVTQNLFTILPDTNTKTVKLQVIHLFKQGKQAFKREIELAVIPIPIKLEIRFSKAKEEYPIKISPNDTVSFNVINLDSVNYVQLCPQGAGTIYFVGYVIIKYARLPEQGIIGFKLTKKRNKIPLGVMDLQKGFPVWIDIVNLMALRPDGTTRDVNIRHIPLAQKSQYCRID